MTPFTLYSSTCSKNTIGLSLRIADFSSALAFAAVLQATSCTPADEAAPESRQLARNLTLTKNNGVEAFSGSKSHTRNGLEVGLQTLRVLCAQLAPHACMDWVKDRHML